MIISHLILLEIIQINLEFYSLSQNTNITPEFIRENLDKDWDWGLLSLNPSVTPEFIRENLDKPWDWGLLSSNPGIT